MPHLTPEDKAFFKAHGYLVKHDTLTPAQVEEAVGTLWEHIEADRNAPETWVNAGPRTPRCGNLPIIKATLHETPLFEMAEEIVGKNRLHTAANPSPHLNYPTGETEWALPACGHMDGYYTPTNGVPEGTVGRFALGVTLYVNHVRPRAGGFTIWPGTHIQAAEYFKTHSLLSLKGGGVREVFNIPPPVEITGPPGTVCFWHGQLVHSVSKNCGKEIRMALISRLRWTDLNDILFETPDDMWEYYKGIS